MTYSLLIAQPLPTDAIAAALAHVLDVGIQDVDVADEGTDPDLRDWDALVLCEKTATRGDVSSSLDVYVQDSVQIQPPENAVAAAFARSARVVVLYPAEEALPSAYWLAAPDGIVTRARLHLSDDEVPQYRIDAVESPVAELPQTPVNRIAEVVRELKVVTPITDTFTAYVRHLSPEEIDVPGTPLWYACTRLGAWEKLVRQMADRWAPSGWYPADLYRERLESRDGIEEVVDHLSEAVGASLRAAVEQLDAQFTELTVEDTGLLRKGLHPGDGASAYGWWWNRRPDPLPW